MKVPSLGDAEIQQALVSPASVFDEPYEVVATPALARLLKVEILRRWELEARAPRREAVNAAIAKLDPKGETLPALKKPQKKP